MKFAFFETDNSTKEFYLKNFNDKLEFSFFDKPLDEEILPQLTNIDGLVIFIYSKITKEVLDNLPNLKFIATCSTGVDHIDIIECKKRNIIVSNVPSYGSISVAEHTFALILSISRRIIESNNRVKRGDFSPRGLTGFDLYGKTIGIIGVGHIGKHVIQIADGFGMSILGFERNPNLNLEKNLDLKFVDLNVLLTQSDIITLHLPYNEETHHFLNTDRFSKMKNGVIIVNTARGGLIDTRALLDALGSGKVGAAGLDVLEAEPLLNEEIELLIKDFDRKDLICAIENFTLFNHPNVLITPHNAFNSIESKRKILETTEENINSFLNGRSENLVNV